MSTAVKRACDACHRRKVKCDGINPCRNCSSAQLTCTYNAIPQKKGPKGSRAKVISELRETQRATSLSAKVQNRMSGVSSPPGSPSMDPTPGLLTSEMVKDCVDFFFNNMYPIMPILNRQRLEQQAMYMDQNRDTYCLLSGLCAFMMIQPGMGMPGGDPMGLDNMPGANIISGQLLLEEAIKVRKGYDYLESPTLNSLCTSYFLFGCYYGLDLHDKAWFHLREATTIAHIIGMTREESYLQYDTVEASKRRRLYWLLFVTERAYALQRRRPLTLQATINLPTLTDDPTDPLAHHLNNFIHLVNLFRPFDDAFVALWNKTRGDCQSTYLAALQKQLNEMPQPYMNGAETQLADLRTNQQWLKTMTWQLSMQNGCLSSNGQDPSMSFQYPIDISRDLMSMASQFSTQSMDMLGMPLIAKLFDVACALTDVLSMQPSSGDPFTVGPREQLHQLLQLLSSLRNGQHHFLPLLLSKVHDVLPRLANPMLQRVPDNACNIDIFDGFGNAGMAQPSVMMEDYDQKNYGPQPTPVPRIEEVHTDSGSSTGAPSGADNNSPFAMVSSPGIMSPSMDYPQMGAEIKQDMDLMSPMSSIPQHSYNQNSSMSSHQQQQQPQQQQQQQQQHQHQHQPQQQQQPQQQHSMYSQNMNQNTGMNGQISQASINNNMNSIGHQHHMSQSQNYNGNVGQMPNNMGQAMMVNNLLQRQPPQRSNSFALHQQNHQQTPQIPRTVGDFHALQRANSETTSMNSMGISPMGAEMDYGGLR